ncbi:NAD(P)H-dependent oxidoreductase [Sphingomonas oryzagri]
MKQGRLRHVVILCHPAKESFCASIAQTYCETVRVSGQEATLRDLYAMGFDPVLKDDECHRGSDRPIAPDIQAELEMIAGAATFVLIYPIWFALPPAMLKGYIDRVLGSAASATAIRQGSCQGVLNDRHILSITTSSVTDIRLDAQGQIESLRNLTTRYLLQAFDMKACDHLHFGGIVDDYPKDFIRQNLYDVEQCAKRACSVLEKEKTVAEQS